MKAGWQQVRLGEIADVQSGGTPLVSNKAFWNGDIPWYSSGELNNLYTSISERHISSQGLENSNAKLFPAGSLLIGMYDTAALKMSILDRAGAFNQAIAGVKPNDRVNLIFVLHAINFIKDHVLGQRRGVRQKNLSLGKIRDIELGLPPLPEQQRIVGILDEAFDGVATAKANAEQNLQNARALFESHLQSVFTQRGEGWVEKRLGEIAKHSLGKMLDKAKNKGELKRYLRNVNVRWFNFDLSDLLEMRFLPEEEAKYTAIKGDVLICEGGYPGRAAIWNEDYPIYFQKALHRVRFFEPEQNKWFVYFLYVQDKRGELRQHFTGTGIQHFTGEALSRFQIPIPPQFELRRFVARFEELDEETQRLESIYQQKLAALDELKQSLLHQAFTGQL